MDTSVAIRIRQLVDRVGLTPQAFGLTAGLSNSVVSKLVRGEREPSYDVLARIARTYPFIDANWLLTGEGEPFRAAVPSFEAPKRGPKAKAPAVLAAAGGADANNRYFRPSMWTRG